MDCADVKSSIENALKCLSDMQLQNGGFESWGTENSESCAQVIVALTALGINPVTDERFVKPNGNPISALLRFAIEGGGFKHILSENELNGMATEQGVYALVAYIRFMNGQTSLYDMSDVTVHVGENPDIPDDPDKNPDDNNQDNQTTKPGDNNHDDQTTKPADNNQGDTPSKPNGGDDAQSPQTGDNSNIVVYFGLMMLSLAGLTVTAASKRRKRHE